jgi:alanyl-tRNA synthetase
MIREFTATVTGCEKADKGYLVTLDATAFYPEGGGQACDVGMLNDANVLDVQEKGEDVVHLCDRPLEVGSTVTGKLDWERRFDLMQQHAGEHILSGLIHKRFGYHNSGFHVGKEVMEVDFDGPIPADALAELEKEANRAVWEDVAVRCWIPDPEELKQVTYRTKRELPWPVRIVQFPGYDSCACCGIHVARTGQIGLIKILSCTKFHQGVRLEMVCGQRAYDYICKVYEQNRQVSQTFSARILETGSAAQRISEQLAAEKFRSAGLEKQVFSAIADGYAHTGNVLHFAENLTSAGIRELADAIAEVCGGIAAVFSGSDGAYSMCLISKTDDVRSLGSTLVNTLNGCGGGKPGAFQGSVRAERSEIEAFFRNK